VVICVNISVRNVSRKTYQEFKAEAARRGLTTGQALTLAMKVFITPEKKKEISILDFLPFDWGERTETASEEVDAILYSSWSKGGDIFVNTTFPQEKEMK
jgi:hypothetical protein